MHWIDKNMQFNSILQHSNLSSMRELSLSSFTVEHIFVLTASYESVHLCRFDKKSECSLEQNANVAETFRFRN